jgi:riboflavin biosynthesis pyrimidine reductase
MIARMRRLFPQPTDPIVARDAYTVDRPRPPGRPWIELCMVASLDGTTVVDERSFALSSPADTEVLLTLRSLADMILVGAGTVRTEQYGPPRKAGQRVAVVSRTGDVDTSSPLFASGAGFLVLPEDAPPTTVESVRAGVGDVDLIAALAQLDVDVIQAEGGPRLNAALFDADVIDELNLTFSPQLAGGDGPRVVTGAASLSRRMDLAHVLEDDGFLFTRYTRRR